MIKISDLLEEEKSLAKKTFFKAIKELKVNKKLEIPEDFSYGPGYEKGIFVKFIKNEKGYSWVTYDGGMEVEASDDDFNDLNKCKKDYIDHINNLFS